MNGGRVTRPFLSPETFADPYPLAQWLREHDPVHWSPELGAWVVTRYADVVAGLHDPRLSAERLPSVEYARTHLESFVPLFDVMRRTFLYHDGAEHTRLRQAVHRAFTRTTIETRRPDIEAVTTRLLDAVSGRPEMDVIAGFARPISSFTIRLVLGFPDEVESRLQKWSEDAGKFVGSVSHPRPQLETIQRTVLEFAAFVKDLLAERRRSPADPPDLLTALAQGSDDRLTDDERVASVILLVTAGHVTTTDLIANGTLALLRHAAKAVEFRARVHERPFVEATVEELLRAESPIQMTARLVREALTIGTKQIRAGEWVLLWLGAANRDPSRFECPDELRLSRSDNRHLSFGSGAHFCLGASMARVQAQVALPALFRRFPTMRVKDVPLVWEQQPAFRGLNSLIVDTAL
jgi:cytochrome P450